VGDGRWLALGTVAAVAAAGLLRQGTGSSVRFRRPTDALAARQLGIEHANAWADCLLTNPTAYLARMRRSWEIDRIGRDPQRPQPQVEFAGLSIPRSLYNFLLDRTGIVFYAQDDFPECAHLPLWGELERARGPSLYPYYRDALHDAFAARLAALVTPQEAGWSLEPGDPGPVSTPAQGRAWAESGACPHPLYHATRHGPSILQHGLLTPSQQPGKLGTRHTGLGFNMGGSFVSLTPYRGGAERLAALHAVANEAFVHPAEVAGWFFEHLVPLAAKYDPQWRPRHLREVLNRRYLRHPSHVVRFLTTFFTMQRADTVRAEPALLFSAISMPRHPVPPEDVGFVTAYLHVDRLVVAGDVPPCPIHRGADRGTETADRSGDRMSKEEADEQWENWERHYGLVRGQRAAALRGVATAKGRGELPDPDQGEIRACSEDLTVVGFTPVLDWRAILHPKHASRGQRK